MAAWAKVPNHLPPGGLLFAIYRKIWSAEWGGKVVFCHGTKHSCGTHVLFHPSLDVDVEHVEVGKRGREIILCAKIDDYRFTFINAPNDIKTQVEFFESLKLRIRKFADENIIIGGDLNCCLTPKDKRGGRPTEQKKQLIDSILSLANSFNLVDVWRKFHPNESLFTWHHQSSAIQCRLDYWLVSKHLLPHVKECNIIPVLFSDHSAVSFNIQSDDFIKRGPGFFKFNNSLLDDQCFVEEAVIIMYVLTQNPCTPPYKTPVISLSFSVHRNCPCLFSVIFCNKQRVLKK